MRLSDKSILITGATGIAAAGADRFVREGARVFVVSLLEDDCDALAASTPLQGWVAADLRDEGAAVTAVAAASKSLGRIDGLFAVAGGSGRGYGDGPLHEVPLSGWDETLALNLTTSFLAARETLKAMLASGGGGSIALVTSVLASHPSPLFATHSYAAAKGAQISLMRAMASHYAPHRIRVNAIAPGLVKTPMSERAFNDPETSRYAGVKQPLVSGFLEPGDVVELATYLLGDESRAVTGQVMGVDGGWAVSEPAQ